MIGEGVDKNINLSDMWFEKAKGQEFVDMNILSEKREIEEIFKRHKKAALAGDSYAMINIAYCYRHGRGVDRDATTACEWLKKSAELGNHIAMFHLGNCYQDGEGVEQNLDEAVKWYQLSEKAGSEKAKKKLALLKR
jgi:TPR repeat protein